MLPHVEAFLKLALSLKQEDGPCLEWPFGTSKGYGWLQFKKRKYLVHRLVCEAAHGKPMCETLEVAHSCHNRRCCRPSHIRWATHAENLLDQRTSKLDPRYKLTQEQVNKIRKDTRLQREIAEEYSVSQQLISNIQTRQRWK